jgi:hypothetical protein
MSEEHNPVELQVADVRNLGQDGPRFARVVGSPDFTNAASAITYLNIERDELVTAERAFRIVDLKTHAVLMKNREIQLEIKGPPR